VFFVLWFVGGFEAGLVLVRVGRHEALYRKQDGLEALGGRPLLAFLSGPGPITVSEGEGRHGRRMISSFVASACRFVPEDRAGRDEREKVSWWARVSPNPGCMRKKTHRQTLPFE